MSEETPKLESVELGSQPTAETHDELRNFDTTIPVSDKLQELTLVFKPREL